MFITVLYANTTAQQFPPHFRAFPQLSPQKIAPLAVAKLGSVLCLWFHKDIVIQLYLAQWYSPDNVYIILHRWFPCLFFFFLSNWILISYIRFVIRSSKTPRLSSWRCRCCSQLAPSHYQKILTRHMTLDDQLNSTLQFTYLIFFYNFCRTFGPALQHFLSDIHKKCPIVRQVRRISTPLWLSGRVLASGPVGPGIDTPPGHGWCGRQAL